MMLFALALLVQSFLTFSRGGIYNFGIALAGAILHLLGKPDRFVKSLFILLIIVGILVGFFFPQLEEFSGGMFSQRFLDTDLSSRESIFEADIKLFLDNPVFGVGPGMGYYFRPGLKSATAHTEYSRLLAEHGIGGVLALLILLIMLARAYFKAPNGSIRAWVVALAFWPGVEMAHAAMRIVAISFMLVIALINWKSDEEEKLSTTQGLVLTSEVIFLR
jgi:O-antigen ligase